MKFVCNHCKKVFRASELEPVEYKEYYDFWGSSISETWSNFYCPECDRQLEEFWGLTPDFEEEEEN